MRDVKAEALIDTLSDTLSEVVAKTIVNTMADLKAEALLNALAETRYQRSKLKHCTRHWSMRCMTRWQKMEAETTAETQGKVETRQLLDTFAYTVVVTLTTVKAESLGDNKTLVNTCSSGFRSTIEHDNLHAS